MSVVPSEVAAKFAGPVEVMAAARQANAADFIHHMPEAFETQLGERGIRLSGGEMQRVAVARAVAQGDFWLSEQPDVPGSKSWDAALTRICSWVRLRETATGRELVFANTHFDHVGVIARRPCRCRAGNARPHPSSSEQL